MDILLAFIVGAVVGLGAHALAPRRDTRGVALGPIVGSLIGGATWLAFTWSGATTLDPWIWVVSFALPFVVVLPLLAVLARVRTSHDARERARLKLS